jgi:histidinol phosphatase-like PHP family hydrolase
MIDLHTHTLLSDGDLIPTELARRAEVQGFRALAMTDHVDTATVGVVVPLLAPLCNGASTRPKTSTQDDNRVRQP